MTARTSERKRNESLAPDQRLVCLVVEAAENDFVERRTRERREGAVFKVQAQAHTALGGTATYRTQLINLTRNVHTVHVRMLVLGGR
jgi:hypothetical protein